MNFIYNFFSDTPYIPGFLAFREVDPIVELVKKQIETSPTLTPDFLVIDGNGRLHSRKFGLACHIGVLLDLPTIGIAKNFYSLSDQVEQNPKKSREDHKNDLKEALKHFGDELAIVHPNDGEVVGLAIKTSDKAEKRCVYVSVGHKISLKKAKSLALRTCQYKIPEPTRQADILSREFVRNMESEGHS